MDNFESYLYYYDLQTEFIIDSFGVFLGLFLVTFVLVIDSLKRKFPSLYRNDRWYIFVVFLCILLSLMARIALNLFQRTEAFRKFEKASFDNSDWGYPLYIFMIRFFTVILPFGALIFSLIYMV